MITLLVGYPASGKSTHIRAYGAYPVVICPDEFRMIITGRDYFAPLEEIVWFSVKITARILLSQKRDIIVDATNLTAGQRAVWVRMAKEYGMDIDCVWLNVPFEECLRRNNERQRVVPVEVMEQMKATFQPPTFEEGFSRCTEILHPIGKQK